jgi:phage FluMu gp28-like protein
VRTIKGLHSRLDNAPGMPGDSVLKIEFENGSRILALPGTGDTIRGLAAAKLVVIDESSRVPDELLAALRPMVATSQGAIVALTTPNGKRGFFYEAWVSGDPAWHRVEIPASMCPRISAEFLAEERKALGETRFQEEYCLQFLDSGVAAFPTTLIEQMFTDDVRPLWS